MQEEEWEIEKLLEEKYSGEKCGAFFADVERLRSGLPLAYIIGYIPFLGCTIHLDSRPLIPRVETEYWVLKVIENIKAAAPEAPRILDLCAGSGCIGVAVLKHIHDAEVDFAEIDSQHLLTIQRNINANITQSTKPSNRLEGLVLESDLFSSLPEGVGYDFILSNPPYIDPEVDRAESVVKKYEPHHALYGGQGGMELINRIITDAPTFLRPNGVLYIEHEPEQTDQIVTLADAMGFRATPKKDQYDTFRYTQLRIKSP